MSKAPERKILEWFSNALPVYQNWKAIAYRDRAYYEGYQWDPEEARKLQSLSQPVITVNHLWSKINSLVGMMLQQQPTIKCLPRGQADATIASIATSVIRYVFDINQLNSILTEVATDMLTTGIGWAEVRITPFLSQDPICIDYVPFDEIIWDPLSRRTDLSDSRFIFRGRWIERDSLEAHFPQAESVLRSLDHLSNPILVPPEVGDPSIWISQSRDMVFVLECQYKVFEETKVIWDGLQAEKYIPELHDDLIAMGLVSEKIMTIPVVRRAIIVNGQVILDEPLPYAFNSFTFVPFIAHRTRHGSTDSGMPLSLVSIVKDIQDEINKRRSKTLHYLQAKRVIAPEGAIPNPDEFMEELRRPDAFLSISPRFSADQIRIEDDLQLGAQHFALMQEAVNEMSLITGIYPDFLGQPTNARTGAALRVRILQSQNSVQRYFSAIERGIKQIAERTLALIKQFYTPERIQQIVDYFSDFHAPVQFSKDTVQIRNTLASLRADIIVKVSQGGFTERQEQLVQLVELMKVLPPELVALSIDVLIDAFDLPQKETIKERLALLIQAQLQAQQSGDVKRFDTSSTLEGGSQNGSERPS